MAKRVGEDTQDRNEAVARSINWVPDLNGATISSVSWATSGLTSESETLNAALTVASIRLSGGVPGRQYVVTCRVTTSQSETLEAEFVLDIND